MLLTSGKLGKTKAHDVCHLELKSPGCVEMGHIQGQLVGNIVWKLHLSLGSVLLLSA